MALSALSKIPTDSDMPRCLQLRTLANFFVLDFRAMFEIKAFNILLLKIRKILYIFKLKGENMRKLIYIQYNRYTYNNIKLRNKREEIHLLKKIKFRHKILLNLEN